MTKGEIAEWWPVVKSSQQNSRSKTFNLSSKPQFPWHKNDAEQNDLNCFLYFSPEQLRKSEGFDQRDTKACGFKQVPLVI